MASSSRKRALVADAAPVSASFPAIGEDKSEWIAEHNVILRYGTSLRLMASCSAFLNESEEFNEVDPTGDWDKWSNRVPGAFTLFYAAIIDPLQPDWSGVQAVLRAVLDGWPTPAPPHKTRLVIGERCSDPSRFAINTDAGPAAVPPAECITPGACEPSTLRCSRPQTT